MLAGGRKKGEGSPTDFGLSPLEVFLSSLILVFLSLCSPFSFFSSCHFSFLFQSLDRDRFERKRIFCFPTSPIPFLFPLVISCLQLTPSQQKIHPYSLPSFYLFPFSFYPSLNISPAPPSQQKSQGSVREGRDQWVRHQQEGKCCTRGGGEETWTQKKSSYYLELRQFETNDERTFLCKPISAKFSIVPTSHNLLCFPAGEDVTRVKGRSR